MIKYTEIKKQPMVNSVNEVIKWVFGMSGVCDDTGTEAYIDAIWPLEDEARKHHSMWTKSEIAAEYGKCEVENGFSSTIQRKIAAKCDKLVVVSDFDYNNAPDTL